MAFELYTNEKVLEDIGANLKRGIERAGGRLKITDHRLLFEAHLLNLQSQPAEIPYHNIASVDRGSALFGLARNVVVVSTKTGPVYEFVVTKTDYIVDLIQQQCVVAASVSHTGLEDTGGSASIATELEKLSKLYENGSITEQEFADAKARILGG